MPLINMKKQTNNNNLKETQKITKDMNLAKVIDLYPDTAEILLDYGLHCVGCFANTFDTIEMGAKIHGMSDSEIAEMVDRLNEVVLYNE